MRLHCPAAGLRHTVGAAPSLERQHAEWLGTGTRVHLQSQLSPFTGVSDLRSITQPRMPQFPYLPNKDDDSTSFMGLL